MDGLAPHNDVRGRGSLAFGDGWAKPDPDGAMIWAVGTRSLLHVLPGADAAVDLYANCVGYPWDPDAPAQELEILVDGRPQGRLTLARQWHDVRVPLGDLRPGELAEITLRFARATRPSAFGEGDSRTLAAAFTRLALVPRAVADPAAFLAAHVGDPAAERALVPPGGGLTVPLPATSRISLQAALDWAACGDCALRVLLARRGQPGQELARLPAGETRLELRFDTPPAPLAQLQLAVDGPLAEGRTAALHLETLAAAPLRRQRAADRPPHVFVYLVDTLRFDVLAGPAPQPSAMRSFAADAVTYTTARATSTWTLPSIASLLTGLFPDRHGISTGAVLLDPARTPTLQGMLREHGYRSVGISHSFVASAAYGIDAGFDDYYVYDNLNGLALSSQEARPLLVKWLLSEAGEAPVFAYLHTVDPHAPYSAPATGEKRPPGHPAQVAAAGGASDPSRVAELRALYDAEVRYTDEQFGRFLDVLRWLGLYDDSYVVLVGDHGEEFGEHGHLEHGYGLFDEVLQVPLVVKHPGGRWAGQRVDHPVSLVDLVPTILATVAPGRALDADGTVLPGPGQPAPRRVRYAELARFGDGPGGLSHDQRALVVGDTKCIEDRQRKAAGVPAVTAYDLAGDPRELAPLDAAANERCRGWLASWDAERARLADRRSTQPIGEGTLERLRALGYLR